MTENEDLCYVGQLHKLTQVSDTQSSKNKAENKNFCIEIGKYWL